MTCSKLRYSRRYNINVDPIDLWCADVSRKNYGKHIEFPNSCKYLQKSTFRGIYGDTLYLHRVVADACVFNPRPDIFNVVDHINHDTLDNRPCNLRHLNYHLNSLNLQTLPGNTPPGVHSQIWYTKNRKRYKMWHFCKSCCNLWSFKTKDQAVQKANEFNPMFFDAVYQAYINSPQSGDRAAWRAYWGKLFVSYSQFKYKIHRQSVRNLEKFVVGDPVYKKMCT